MFFQPLSSSSSNTAHNVESDVPSYLLERINFMDMTSQSPADTCNSCYHKIHTSHRLACMQKAHFASRQQQFRSHMAFAYGICKNCTFIIPCVLDEVIFEDAHEYRG